jgi:hypothetical protein
MGVRRRESAVRRRLRHGAAEPHLASLTPTRLVLTVDVAAEIRAVVVASDGAERVVDACVEFPDGARAMLLAAAWRDGRGVLDAVREIGLGCLRRLGAERLLASAAAAGERISVRASIEDVRRILATPRHAD